VQRPLLLADAVINLVLGALLLVYPQWLVEALGMPVVATTFFPNVLGGVLFGIGLALFIASRGGAQGLGLDGAIANPLDKKMMAAIITAETLMGKDEWCEAYLQAYRQKRFEF